MTANESNQSMRFRTGGRGQRARAPRIRSASWRRCRCRAASQPPARGPTRSRTAHISSTPRATRSRMRRGVGSGASTTSSFRRATPRPAPRGRDCGSTGFSDWNGSCAGRDSPRRSRRSNWRPGRAGSCVGPTPPSRKTTPSAQSRCDVRAISAWAATWTSTRCPSRRSFRR
jgi:hypothetical protein